MHVRWVTSDHHIGHNGIKGLSPNREGDTLEEHNEALIRKWNEVVKKNDTVYILGDFAFNSAGIETLKRLKGNKVIIGGNHDKNLKLYSEYVNQIRGVMVVSGFWLTHIPIHPVELYNRKNIHGHVHNKSIPDDRYINVCVDVTGGYPVMIQDIIDGKYTTHDK